MHSARNSPGSAILCDAGAHAVLQGPPMPPKRARAGQPYDKRGQCSEAVAADRGPKQCTPAALPKTVPCGCVLRRREKGTAL